MNDRQREERRQDEERLIQTLSRLVFLYGPSRVLRAFSDVHGVQDAPVNVCGAMVRTSELGKPDWPIKHLACEGHVDHEGHHYGRIGEFAASWERWNGDKGMGAGVYAVGPRCTATDAQGFQCQVSAPHNEAFHENEWRAPKRWSTNTQEPTKE